MFEYRNPDFRRVRWEQLQGVGTEDSRTRLSLMTIDIAMRSAAAPVTVVSP